ncbi:MAG TPA: DUF3237 domain-containing protein [Sphingomonas sp.]|nr:DUF3237 domain-containing protein [Sphingomonas sp.]
MSDAFAGLDAQLRPLCTSAVTLGDTHVIDSGPRGRRAIVDVLSVRMEGERLNARLLGRAAADWLTISPDGSYGTLDVRATLQTDDGAIIYVEYGGRIVFGADGINAAFGAPLFETGDPRYAWLNRLQAVGKGRSDVRARTIHYRIYEVC